MLLGNNIFKNNTGQVSSFIWYYRLHLNRCEEFVNDQNGNKHFTDCKIVIIKYTFTIKEKNLRISFQKTQILKLSETLRIK